MQWGPKGIKSHHVGEKYAVGSQRGWEGREWCVCYSVHMRVEPPGHLRKCKSMRMYMFVGEDGCDASAAAVAGMFSYCERICMHIERKYKCVNVCMCTYVNAWTVMEINYLYNHKHGYFAASAMLFEDDVLHAR